MNKKPLILVTGNKGYIGSVLVGVLIKRGYNVCGLDTAYYEDCLFYKTKEPKITQIHKDIRNVSEKDVEGVDGIIHLAALSNDPLSEFDPQLTIDINHKSTVRLGKIAKKLGVPRFVFSSSQSMYGISKEDMVYEDSIKNPITAYGRTKINAEYDLGKLADTNFTPVFLRPSTVYGVSPRLRLDIVLNNLVAWAYTTGTIKLKSDGTPWRPVVHIQDICDAYIAAFEAPKELVSNEAFNVGESRNYRVKDMATLVQKFVPGCQVTYATSHSPDERSYKVNSDKIRKVLKEYFTPKWNAEDGIVELLDAYKKNNLTFKKFTGTKFIRLNKLKNLIESDQLDSSLFWKSK